MESDNQCYFFGGFACSSIKAKAQVSRLLLGNEKPDPFLSSHTRTPANQEARLSPSEAGVARNLQRQRPLRLSVL